MKATADEIKKSLRMCTEHKCAPSCLSYEVEPGCCDALMEDTLACIERLEAEREPKNRVLKLEEAQKKCQEDGITWYESLRHESPIVFPAYVTPIDPTDELVNIYTFFAGTEETVELYGKEWRCWLRKPTETERWETPWAGDSRE